MARKIIDIGVVGNDGTGDSIRDSFRKVNDNFRELYSSLGLGDRLTFIGLDDLKISEDPASKISDYGGLVDGATGSTPVVTVNNDESGIMFKHLRPGSGISIDFSSNPSEITINSEFSRISADTSPALGGNLSAKSGGINYRIVDLQTPVTPDEAVNKAYADTKISRAGTNAIDPETGEVNTAMGRMSGPLILARDPEPDDDEVYGGLIAATKRYVDNSSFGSVANLYVATSGQDDRPGVSNALQGRALAYAYRTLEAALKRAEELVLEAREEIGPYKKVLTYNDGENEAYLSAIETSPASGNDFDASPIMSVDTVILNTGGTNYNVGDRLTLTGGTLGPGGQAAIIEVLSTLTTPGAIVTYKIVSSGAYTKIPGASEVTTTSDSDFGTGATFNLTYKVNNVQINNPGSGYSLVSVRIEGGGGAGAFGTAYVSGGAITGITITDQGRGFTSEPTVRADLPRFKLFTNGLRTDYTGDLSPTPAAARTRDLREGLYLYGTTSGALAQILSHDGSLDGPDEIFDVDIKYGAFEIGESIAYGDVSRNIQVSILVESGVYEENLPLKVPQNVSIVGDEFRRCIIRPKKGTSSSPWAFQKFRRDLVLDGLPTATQLFGHHYLQDSSKPVYPKINNQGYYNAAATLIQLNKSFLQEEVIAWINTQISRNAAPFNDGSGYNEDKCRRDVGLIVDAVLSDAVFGTNYRSTKAGLAYLRSYSSEVTDNQRAQTIAGINKAKDLVLESVTGNALITLINTNFKIITDIISFGSTYAPELVYTNPTGISEGTSNSKNIIIANKNFIKSEIIAYINNNLDLETFPEYNADTFARDVEFIVDSLIYDLTYGGNSQTVDSAIAYVSPFDISSTVSVFTRLREILPDLVQNIIVTRNAGNTEIQVVTLPAGNSSVGTILTNLIGYVLTIQESGAGSAPSIVDPTFAAGNTSYNSTRTSVLANISTIQDNVIEYLNNVVIKEFTYNENLCKRDLGLIIDSMIFDLKWSGYNRTVSSALKYYQNASGLIAIGAQKSQTIAAIRYAETLIQKVINNEEIVTLYQTLYRQIIDNAYVAETGVDSVIGELFLSFIDVISGSILVNQPKNNDQMDVFLANDAVRWQAITCQGHGGFMCVLDPEGQILAKSPYAQECASFSKSINAQTFAGGMFIDGFSGNLEFQIKNVVSPTRLEVGGLERMPNLPCSFIVEDVVYLVNYIRDFVYNKDGSTATLVLDETTPWPYPLFTYDSDICSRDVGLIIDGLGYDILLGTNFNARKAGLTYRGANASVVINDQKRITIRALDHAHQLAKTVVSLYPGPQSAINTSNAAIADIVERGSLYAPALTFTEPTGLDVNLSNAKQTLLTNIDFIKDEVLGYVKSNYPAVSYDAEKCARDIGYIIESLVYDLIYGGNSQTRDAGLKYYSSVITGGPLQIPVGEKAATIAALNWAKYVAKEVIVNGTLTNYYSSTPQIEGIASDAGTQAIIETLMTNLVDIIDLGVSAAAPLELPDPEAYTYDADNKSARTLLNNEKANIQSSVVEFVNTYGNLYEILMPGNRSILGNDFTQVNDLGYGIFATNGGLVESVSMFTYYCHISYYSLNGAQIRSVSGSSSHGNYALVAEGSDPLEVPTPTGLYQELAQRVICYAPSPSYYNAAGGLFVFVDGYDYTPLGGSELEVDHGGVIYRYPVTSVVVGEGLPDGVARLNITSDTTGNFDGIYDQIPHGEKMSLRLNSQILLTGDLLEVAVRPSTGLRLRESQDIYRVLQFDSAIDANGPFPVHISEGTPGTFEVRNSVVTITSASIITTAYVHGLKKGQKIICRTTDKNLIAGATYYVRDVLNNKQFTVATTPTGPAFTLVNGTGLNIEFAITHNYLENYLVSFVTTGTLPAPLVEGTRYYVSAEGLSETSFRVSAQRNGSSISITSAGSGSHRLVPEGITRTSLRENYNYVDFTLFQPGEYVGSSSPCTISEGIPGVVNATAHGLIGGEVIKFESTGTFPFGITGAQWYFVLSTGITPDTFLISAVPDGTPVDISGSYTGSISYGIISGGVGSTTFAVVPVSPEDTLRATGMRFVFKGEEYVISRYESEVDTNKPYGRITLNRPLVDSIINFPSTYTIRGGVPARTVDSTGTLTIRISLTRVTSHDILEVGTGSYADTNYPNEIYGPPVNALAPENETVERGVGRVFYVTTDQFGNFNVGPFFRVDQGTGRVTFSAAIALSNLDGIGFKRGVPVSEFSVDSGFTDNSTDTVPTENATRIYIERRLGLTHTGTVVEAGQLIPTVTGGFMSLDGQLKMKANMDLDGYNVINVGNPINLQDAVNLQSLLFNNFQEVTITNLESADLLTFTGLGNEAINAKVVGDLAFTVNESTNEVNAQIVSNSIINSDVNADAAIAQSKLAMTPASTRANATGILQADRGIASFDSAQFTATDGWITVKDNGLVLSKLAQIGSKTLVGNSTVSTASPTAVSFSTVVDLGLGIKKAQYNSTGILRRTSTSSNSSDSDYVIIEASSGASGFVASDVNKLIQRDNNGDFGARNGDLQQLKIDGQIAIDSGSTSASGGYIRLYGYNSNGGILVSNGTAAGDKTTYYDNDAHIFRTQSGLANAPILASSIQVTAITTGGNTTGGTITGRWTLTGTSPNESRLQATYSADLAEYYEGDKEYEVGTVLVFGGEKEVTTTNSQGDTRVAGVVSNTAAFVMYDACPGAKNLVALQGRVPCRVMGKIKKGDMLVTARTPGVAVAGGADIKVGTVVGKALQDYDSDHIGTIEIAVGRT